MNPRPTSTALKRLEQMSAAELVDFVRATTEQRPGTGPVHFNPIGRTYENEDYYANLPPETAAVLKGLVTLEFASMLQVGKQLPLVYVKGAITGGAYALREAVLKGETSLYRLDEGIGSPRGKKHILMPAIRNNQALGTVFQKLFPDHGIVSPTAREMGAKIALQHRAFGTIKYDEVDFMVPWFLQQMHFEHIGPSTLDGNATRNTILESLMETLIEFGLVPPRPSANIRLLDENIAYMPLSARMEKYAEFIKLGLANDLDFREAAWVFCVSATLDQWRRNGDPRVANRNARLRNPPREELGKIDRLRAEMDPIIKAYGAKNLRPQDLLPEYREAYARAQVVGTPPLPPELRQRLKEVSDAYFADIEDITSIKLGPEHAARLAKMPTPNQRRFDPEAKLFGTSDRTDPANRSLFFHDTDMLFKKCAEWEQALLPFVIWAMEIILLPYNAPMATVVFDDFKRGEHARRYMEKHGLSDINEALPHAGARAAEFITEPAKRAARRRVKRIKESRPGKVVIGPDEFNALFDVVEHLRATIPNFCGMGPNETSPAFRMLVKQIYAERNADEAFFPGGWAVSPELVQLRNHARNIQCEFIRRPATGPVNFHIYTETPPGGLPKEKNDRWLHTPDSLTRDAETLAGEFRRCAASLTAAPEQGLALARLWARNDLIRPEVSRVVNENFLRSAYAAGDVLTFNKKRMDEILGAQRDSATAARRLPLQPGDASAQSEYLGSWGAASYQELLDKLRRAEAGPLPQNAAALLKKFAHLWLVPPERLAPDHAPDDTPRRAAAIDTEKELMRGFAAASRSADGFLKWLEAQRPTDERHIHAPGPQR